MASYHFLASDIFERNYAVFLIGTGHFQPKMKFKKILSTD